MKLYAATLTCKEFAKRAQPTRPAAIIAESDDEALGKAIQMARSIWNKRIYSEHNADIIEVPPTMIAQVTREV